MERNGDRKEMGFPRDCTPALCLAPCHPTAPGLTEGRGNNAEALPCRAAVPEPARGRGAVAPPARLEQGHAGPGARETPAPKRLPPTSLGKPQTPGRSGAPRQPPQAAAAVPHAWPLSFLPPAGRFPTGRALLPPGTPRSPCPGRPRPRGEARRHRARRSLPRLRTPARGSATSGQQKLPSA